VLELSRREGIGRSVLHRWHRQARRAADVPVPRRRSAWCRCGWFRPLRRRRPACCWSGVVLGNDRALRISPGPIRYWCADGGGAGAVVRGQAGPGSAGDRTSARRQGLAGRGHDRYARGFDGVARLVQQVLGLNPFSNHLFVFRGLHSDPKWPEWRLDASKRERASPPDPSLAHCGRPRLRRTVDVPSTSELIFA